MRNLSSATQTELKSGQDQLNPQSPLVKGIFEPRTSSIQYVVADPSTRRCAIIDPVLDFDERSGSIGTQSADELLTYVESVGLSVEWILDTHPHADHFSAIHYLSQKTGAKSGTGAKVTEVQTLWKGIYDLPDFRCGAHYWDHVFRAGDRFKIGELDVEVLHSPGHTLASITYLAGNAAFIHDTLFMPDSGTARTDFPGGSASALWQSIQSILALPAQTRLFTGHDYQPGGRAVAWESSIAEQLTTNIHLQNADEKSFIAQRQARDRTLPMPKLLLHALQVNMQGGRLPAAVRGRSFLKIPINAFTHSTWPP